jgi:hypothetical protein
MVGFHNYVTCHSNYVEISWKKRQPLYCVEPYVNMKGCVFLLLTMICLLVPVGVSHACGSKHVPTKREVAHVGSHKKTCCARHRNHRSGDSNRKCSDICNESGCDCAHSLPVFALKVQPTGLIPKNLAVVDNCPSWFFLETSPKPVYLSLWMPPNIG